MSIIAKTLPRITTMMPAAIASLSRKPRPEWAKPQRMLFRLAFLDPRRSDAYRELVGGGYGALPLTYFYLLAQRAQLAMMTDRSYPYPIPGMIHIENALQLHQAPQLDRPFLVDVTSDFHIDEQHREQASFEIQFKQNEQLRVTCRSDYLIRRPARRSGRRGENLDFADPTGAEARWRFNVSSGWRYARVSGDYNPIHLSAGLARLFGFRQPILQGMYGLARTAAAIEAEAEHPLAAISVRFRRPMLLPICVVARWSGNDSSGHFALYAADSDTLHMHGEYELA